MPCSVRASLGLGSLFGQSFLLAMSTDGASSPQDPGRSTQPPHVPRQTPSAWSKILVPALVLLLVGEVILILSELNRHHFAQQHERERAEWLVQYEENLEKWESQHISDYRMSIHLPYSSMDYDRMPLTAEVRDGRLVSVVDVRGQEVTQDDPDFTYHYPQHLTVAGLFSYTYQIYLTDPPMISTSYNPAHGYPEVISINLWEEPCCQEQTYEIRDFVVLP